MHELQPQQKLTKYKITNTWNILLHMSNYVSAEKTINN
jgi:hypothetical protein